MKEDKLHLLRKTFIIICLILLFTTAGLFLVKTQIKTVTLDYYGNKQTINTLAGDINAFLLQNKIVLNQNDKVYPVGNTQIENGLEIKIYSDVSLAKIDIDKQKSEFSPMVAKVEEVIETIPFEEEKRDNPTIIRGTENTVQEGKEGKKSVKYIVRYNNDKEIQRAQVNSEVLIAAQNKIIDVGTKLPVTASRSSIVQSVASQPVTEGFKQYNIRLPLEQQQYAYNICQKYGIQYELFLAIMYKESGFNPNAVGGGNSYGLCQIHVSNHANLRSKLGLTNFLDPYDNMTAGAYLLSSYFGSARKVVSGDAVEVYALNSYNMGEGVYFSTCYSKGILNREYSNSVIALRNRLVATGTL